MIIQKIKDYSLIASTLILAVLTFLFLRRGETIKDLQRERVLNKLNGQLKDAITKSDADTKEYQDAIESYNELRDRYNRMFPDSPV